MPVVRRWPRPVWATFPGGAGLYVTLSTALGRGLVATGDFDPAVRETLERSLREGDCFVDVGANVGFYTLIARRKVGPSGAVHSFEIDERSAALLERSVRKNAWTNVEVHPHGLGAEAKKVGVVLARETGHTAVARSPSDERAELRPIRALDEDLDMLARQRVACVKVDVEGYELEVLKGSRAILADLRPTVVCEAVGASRTDVERFMLALGYRCHEVEGAFTPCLLFEPTTR